MTPSAESPPNQGRDRRRGQHRQQVHLLVRQQLPPTDQGDETRPSFSGGGVLDHALAVVTEPRGLQDAPQDGVEQGAEEAADGAEHRLGGWLGGERVGLVEG